MRVFMATKNWMKLDRMEGQRQNITEKLEASHWKKEGKGVDISKGTWLCLCFSCTPKCTFRPGICQSTSQHPSCSAWVSFQTQVLLWPLVGLWPGRWTPFLGCRTSLGPFQPLWPHLLSSAVQQHAPAGKGLEWSQCQQEFLLVTKAMK